MTDRLERTPAARLLPARPPKASGGYFFPMGHHVMTQKKGHIGSAFEDYLAELETREETRAIAVKRVLAWELGRTMERHQMSSSAMAEAMDTNRSQLDRILDPDYDHVNFATLSAAAKVLGLRLRLESV